MVTRGESPASHRDRRYARVARREEGEYRESSTDEQRGQTGWSAGRMHPVLPFRAHWSRPIVPRALPRRMAPGNLTGPPVAVLEKPSPPLASPVQGCARFSLTRGSDRPQSAKQKKSRPRFTEVGCEVLQVCRTVRSASRSSQLTSSLVSRLVRRPSLLPAFQRGCPPWRSSPRGRRIRTAACRSAASASTPSTGSSTCPGRSP